MRVKTMLSLIAGASLAFAAMAAHATPIPAGTIDFETGGVGSGGTITTVGDDVIGSGILINMMTVEHFGAGDGTYDVDGTGLKSGQSTGILNFDTRGNGYIEIIGSVAGVGTASDPVVLLSGTISSFTWEVVEGSTTGGFFSASGIDTKNALLLEALGIDLSTGFGYFGFSIATKQTTDGTFMAKSTDILNTAVPEPASMLLMGSGLLGLAGFGRKRKK